MHRFIFWTALLLSTAAMAQDDDAFFGPPAAVPQAAPVVAQVRMVQEGENLRLLVDAMGGLEPVTAHRPGHEASEPLLVDAYFTWEIEGAPEPVVAEGEEPPPPERHAIPDDLNWRVPYRDGPTVELEGGIWFPIAESRIPIPEKLLDQGARVTLHTDVRLNLGDRYERIPAADAKVDVVR